MRRRSDGLGPRRAPASTIKKIERRRRDLLQPSPQGWVSPKGRMSRPVRARSRMPRFTVRCWHEPLRMFLLPLHIEGHKAVRIVPEALGDLVPSRSKSARSPPRPRLRPFPFPDSCSLFVRSPPTRKHSAANEATPLAH